MSLESNFMTDYRWMTLTADVKMSLHFFSTDISDVYKERAAERNRKIYVYFDFKKNL